MSNQESVELHELNWGDKFKITDENPGVPPSGILPIPEAIYVFGGIDGMYSKCFIAGVQNSPIIHLKAWTLVQKL